MKEKSVEEIKNEILIKRTSDKKRLNNLAKIAAAGVLSRMLIYALPYKLGGLLVEMLWIPLVLLIFALPFYGIENLLDRIKKE